MRTYIIDSSDDAGGIRLASYIYLELDLFAVVLLLLMVGLRNRGDVQSVEQRLFNLVLLSTAATIFFDAFQWYFDGRPGAGMRIVTIASSYLYYITNTAVPSMWLVYCDFKILGSMSGLRRRMRLYSIPFACSVAFLVANGWTGIVFGFDAENYYGRGSLFLEYALITYLPAFLTAIMIIRRLGVVRAEAERRELGYLLSFMILPTAGFVAQMLFYGLPLTWIASTISLFIIYTKVQNRRIYTDELTGLSNRRQIAREFSRRNDAPDPAWRIYAIMIDADDFKKINDRHGHAAGDRMLVCAAGVLGRLCAQRGDFIARMGGDEFLILATRKSDELFALPGAIEEAVTAFNADAADDSRMLSLSCGVAVYGEEGVDSLDALLSAADGAMYRNKAARKAARIA